MMIHFTRHEFSTADVFVVDAAPITAGSYATGTPTTIRPRCFYIDDEHKAGDWWLTIIAWGHVIKKDGTEGARETRVSLKPADVALEVREALAEMRPDLADWLA